jgi:hypothetical protein
MNTSSTSRIRTEHSMSTVERMKKEDKSSYGRDTMERIRDGRSSISTRLKQFKPRE